jgi:hypothetical protein
MEERHVRHDPVCKPSPGAASCSSPGCGWPGPPLRPCAAPPCPLPPSPAACLDSLAPCLVALAGPEFTATMHDVRHVPMRRCDRQSSCCGGCWHVAMSLNSNWLFITNRVQHVMQMQNCSQPATALHDGSSVSPGLMSVRMVISNGRHATLARRGSTKLSTIT